MPKPANPLSDTLYDMPSLNKIFFLSSILLLLATIWMAWQDYDRNWKNYQRKFNEIALKRAEKDAEAANKAIDHKELDRLHDELVAAQKAVDGKKGEIAKLEEEQAQNHGPLEVTLKKFQFDKSEADALKFRAEKADSIYREAEEKANELKAKNDPGAARAAAELDGLKKDRDAAAKAFEAKNKETLEAKLAWEAKNDKDVELQAKLEKIREEATAKEKDIAKLEKDLQTKKRAIAKLEPSLAKDLLNTIGVDFIAPTIKIDQIILPHFQEDVNFSTVFKIDRCRTCHLAIDKKGWTEKELPKVFRSHPNLDLYVGDNSPHPVSKFGCTICHNGQGRSVDFFYAAHTPRNDEQRKQWEKDYDWQPVPHYDNPMLPMPYVEAACTKCHGSQHRVTMADTLNEGKRIVETVGCYGCHPIVGTEDLRKPGPSLYGVKFKVTKDWAYQWISRPTHFRPTTKMPQPFFLSNTSDEDSKRRSVVMIQAIIEYLWSQSDTAYGPKAAYPAPPAGDVAKGEKVVKAVGCLACHVVGDINDKGNQYRSFGPNLSAVGSKLNAGWTYAWLRDPKQYFHYTSMPNLRLSDQEAADATAYLLSLKHPEKFEDLKAPEVNETDLDDTIRDFLKGSKSAVEADKKVKEMSRDEKMQWLGAKAIGQMGCFGCHDIKGFEKTKKIGAELTGSNSTGTKDITKFDFGFREDLMYGHHPLPNDRINWVRAKLADPRTYDGGGRIVAFEDRLRMPKFNLAPEEIEQVTTYVLSFRRETVNPLYLRNLSHDETVVDRGKRLVTLSNCAGCHKVGVWTSTLAVDPGDDDAGGRIWQDRLYAARTILTDGRQVDNISDDELRIVKGKGIDILVKKGTWLAPDVVQSLQQNNPPITSVLVYGAGEGGIRELVNLKDDDNKAPPYIVGEGAKVNPDWFFKFLKAPTEIRPWLAPDIQNGVRMPTFGFTDDQAMLLVEHFAHIADKPFPFVYEAPLPAEEKAKLVAAGKKVFDANQCGKCHVVKGVPITTDKPAPPFALVGPRIRKDWFSLWIRDPQGIAPGVSMPAFSTDQVKPEDEAGLWEFIKSLREQEK